MASSQREDTHDTDPSSSLPSDDWEYEYHDTETETFYINLDLTTYNGPLRAPRKRAADTNLENPRTTKKTDATRENEDDDDDERRDVESDQERVNEDDEGNEDAAAAATRTKDRDQGNDDDGNESEEGEEEDTERERIQIMELHSRNPIISYRNQIFTCEWADLIGTELSFMNPEGYTSELERLRQTEKYDLLAASSVKLLGRKASLISTTHSRPRTTAAASAAESTTKKKPLSNQARFFERLKEIKRAKGESDTIRTSIPQRRFSALYNLALASEEDTVHQLHQQQTQQPQPRTAAPSLREAAPTPAPAREEDQGPTASRIAAETIRQERLKAWARTGQQLAEVEKLKKKALKGDEEAVTALENIMARTVEKAAAEARGEMGSSQEDVR